jgi:hypothetical protein
MMGSDLASTTSQSTHLPHLLGQREELAIRMARSVK